MKKKILVAALVLSMALPSALPLGAQAQSAAELQAQINNLLALISQLQSKLSNLSGGVSTPSQNYVFTSNLTVGSTGEEVRQLQMFLVSKGFLTMPAGVPFGYFGNLTQEALARYQASVGISPAAGYFGPITRAQVNSALASGTPTPGGNQGGITTPGMEGIMSVSSYNSGLRSTVYEDDTQVPILGFRVSAKQSDIAIQRVKIDLGSSSTLYNRILSKLYVTEGDDILASTDVNSSTVVKDGGNYYVTISGFNHIVPKDGNRSFVIKADINPSVDSTYRGTAHTVRLADNGIRGIDGAGIDHYSPSSGSSISRNISVQQSLVESATLRISLNSNTPRSQEIVADSGVNDDEYDRLALLTFDLRASRDDVTLTDLQVNIAKSGTGEAQASSTVYLYEGSTEIDNASVSNGTATFSNLSYVIPKDSTKTLSVRTDVRNANANPATFVASIPSSGITAENSLGDTLSSGSINGSVTGYQLSVRNVGSEVALASKSVNTSGVPQDSDSTSFMTATFNVKIRAVGSDLILGTPASTTPAFDYDSFVVYRNGIAVSVDDSAKAISFGIPSGANMAGLTNSFRVPEGTEVTIPVTFQLRGRVGASALASGLYSIGLENITWIAGDTLAQTDFMAGDQDWRTIDVSFP